MASASTSVGLYTAVTSPAHLLGASPQEASEKAHHLKDGKGFINPWDSYIERTGWQIGRAMIWRKLTGKSNTPDTTPPTVNVVKPNFLPTRHNPGGTLRATWLGHACYLVEFPSGLRVLFDPVFEHRCSPFTWLGPQRYTPAPCQVEDIPYIDVVVLSHNHYDHTSHPTLMAIHKKHPNTQFFCPLGNKKWFNECGIHNVTELDWWEERDVRLTAQKDSSVQAKPRVSDAGVDRKSEDPETIDATIGALPCQHTSARTPFDKSKTLWASWSIQSGGKSVWFAGDTGYRSVPDLKKHEDDYAMDLPHCPAFVQIGQLRGPFDLGLIPIGAYDPRYIMSPMHANPYDSVNIFADTKCKKALGMHWGTWVLTEEEVLEPPKLLREAMRWRGLVEKDATGEDPFTVCDIGESREY